MTATRMDDEALRTRLRSLGIDGRTWRAVALLPLVEVAWADGRVQDQERARILGIARDSGALSGDGRMVLEGWLTYRPSPRYFALGREVLAALGQRLGAEGLQAEDILQACEAVARAAGGLFGLVGTIEAPERELLTRIARELPLEGEGWGGLMDRLDHAELPDDEEEVTDPTGFVPPAVRDPEAAAPEPAAVPHLRVYDQDPPRAVPLGHTTRIGRGGDNELQLPRDRHASRRHSQVYRQQGRWYVVDCGSAHGTFVDGEQVLERQLFGGEELRVGETRLRFVRPGDAPA